MACRHCANGNYCKFHEGSSKLATGLQYSKTYQVYDLEESSFRTLSMRAQDRRNNQYIEIEEKFATCTKCRRMDNCKNYFVTTRTGGANVCVCQFCVDVQFANDGELFRYVKSKLFKRYTGTDEDLKRLLLK